MRILFYFLVSVAVLAPHNLYAQHSSRTLSADSDYDKVVMPDLFSESVLVDDGETPPIEPNIIEVKFLKMPDIRGNSERVDRLIQGIKKDIPPEYDHYGHEIRRHMAGVGNLKIFEDEEYLIQQIKNVRKAGVIADFWKRHLKSEVKELENIVGNNENTSFADRTAFKQNKIASKTFIISLEAWIKANEKFLMTIYNSPPDMYEVLYPEITIKSSKIKLKFYNNFKAKQIKLKEIRAYQSFAMMVY